MADAEVRPSTHDDVPALTALMAEVAGEGRWIGRELPLDLDEVAASYRTSIDDPASLSLVAVVDGQVVGSLGLRPDGHGHLDLGMFLASTARGRGLGGRLVDEALAWARGPGGAASGAFKVCLQAWPHNVAALALYRSRGFRVEGHLHRHWRRADGELWDAVVMGLPLDRSGT